MMPNTSRRRVLQAGGVGVAALLTGLTGSATANTNAKDWPQAARDGANTGYNPTAAGVLSEAVIDWSYDPEIEGEIYAPVIADGTLFLATTDAITAFDANSGLELWTNDDEEFTSPVAVGPEYVLIGTGNGLLALSKTFGSEEWRFETEIGLSNPPTIHDGTVYIGHHDCLFAIDAASGQQEWELETTVSTAPAVTDNMIWSGAESLSVNILLAPDLVEGSAIEGEERATVGGWLAYRGPATWMEIGPPTLSNASDAYMSGNGVVRVNAVEYLETVSQRDPLDDEPNERWDQWVAGEETAVPGSPVLADDQVIFGTGTAIEDVQDSWRENAGTVYAVSVADGETDWTFETDGPINTAPAATDSTVYVSSDDGYLYALDRERGDERWRQFVGDGIGAPVVVGGQVFVTSSENGLLALEAAPDESNGTDDDSGADDSNGTDDTTDQESGSESQDQDTDSETDDDSDDGFGPGFGVPGAITALGGAGYLLARRRSDRDE